MKAFEEVLGDWVKGSEVELGAVVSVDGNALRGIHGKEAPGMHLASAYAAGIGGSVRQGSGIGGGQGGVGADFPWKGR